MSDLRETCDICGYENACSTCGSCEQCLQDINTQDAEVKWLREIISSVIDQLEGGFISCGMCNNEVGTEGIDPIYELKKALKGGE